MNSNPIALIFVLVVTINFCFADDWRQFRGTGGVSAADASIPTEFDDETNVAWKSKLPAKGASSPIVVDGKVIVTCSGGDRQDQLFAVAVDVATGEKLWTQKFWATGRCFVHPLSANAAPTPVSDGKHVYVFFSSNDLACLDLDGNLVWYRGLAVDYPKAGNDVGMASSPVVKDGVVAVQVECQGDSFAMGLNATDGTTIWTQERPKEGVWSSPLIVDSGDSPLVLLQSRKGFDILDLMTGQQRFEAEGETSSISSAATMDEKLYVPINGTTSYALSSDGQLTEEWNSEQVRPRSMSSVIHDGKIYTLNRAGVLSSYDLRDGSQLNKLRVIKGSAAWATPVIAGGHMYLFAQGGQSYVVKLADQEDQQPEVVHQHTFEDEVFLGSPAVSDNALFVRSDRFLWKIAKPN